MPDIISDTAVDYIRISVTDKCNLRCMYCMPPEGIRHKPHEEILRFEEIVRLAGMFAALGIRKIRLTGGEPLVRKGIIDLIEKLSVIDGIHEVCLTTNGILLPRFTEELKRAGIKKVNISIDTLQSHRFKTMTGYDFLHDVLDGIDKAKEMNFYSLKLNIVVMRHINDDEILDFINFALLKNITLRFIEFMKVTPLWNEKYFIPLDEVKRIVRKQYALQRLGTISASPAEYYRIGDEGLVGFIKTDIAHCRNCSRLRLTSTGDLKLCLYEDHGINLKDLLRNGADNETILGVIKKSMGIKRTVDYRQYENQKHYMCSIGG